MVAILTFGSEKFPSITFRLNFKKLASYFFEAMAKKTLFRALTAVLVLTILSVDERRGASAAPPPETYGSAAENGLQSSVVNPPPYFANLPFPVGWPVAPFHYSAMEPPSNSPWFNPYVSWLKHRG